MKRNSFYLIIILLLSMVFVSCSAEPSSMGNSSVAKVAVMASKALSANTSITELPRIEDLYVFYTAEKTSDGFKTGETLVPTPIRTDNDGKGLPEIIGQTRATFGENGLVQESDTWFSTGTWKFSFYALTTPAYDEDKIIYEAENVPVEIIRPENESDNIGGYAEISLQISRDPRGDAEVYVNGVYVDFGYSFDSSATYTMSIFIDDSVSATETIVGAGDNSNGRVSFTVTGPVKSFKEGSFGNHTLSFEVTKDTDSMVYASGRITIPTEKGYTTTISGDLESLESVAMVAINLDLSTDVINGSISSKTPFTGTSETEQVVVTSDVAPDMTNQNNNTKVTFASSDLSSDSSVSYSLNVEVTTAAMGKNSGAFEIIKRTGETVESSVAEIDLTLVKTTTTTIDNNTTIDSQRVTTFNSPVTIETYVEPGLDGVNVYYKNGDTLEDMGQVDYDSSTGKITFTTGHFSKYIVSTETELWIMNDSTGKKYKSLQFAMNDAKAGERIVLLGNINISEPVTVSKDIKLNLNGFDITATNTRALWVTDGLLTVTGNGTIKTEGSDFDSSSSVIRVGSASVVNGSAGLVIDESITVYSDHCYGVTVFGKNTDGQNLEVRGTVSVTGEGSAISGNGSANLTETDITIKSGAVVSATQDAAIYHPQAGNLTVEGGEITGTTGIEVKGGEVIISGGTITATAEPSHIANTNGTSTRGYAVVAVENSSYKGDASIEISGGTFQGAIGVEKDSESEAFDAELVIKGGVFKADPTVFIASGYCVKHDGLYDVAAHTPGNTHGVPVEGIDGYKHTLYCDHCGELTETVADCINDHGHCSICGQQMTVAISFNANNGSGTMSDQDVVIGVDSTLSANSFTRAGFIFTEWNTAADGSGTSFSDECLVNLDENLTLYAQWKKDVYSEALTLKFKAAGNFNIRKPSTDTILKYSINGGPLQEYTESNAKIPVNAGDEVSFYANGTGSSSSSYMYIGCDYTAYCDVYGNIMSLQDGLDSNGDISDEFKTSKVIDSEYEFKSLFVNNCRIQDASGLVLPATTLKPHCYDNMFYRCEYLTKAPALPATSLAEYCYYYMFIGCIRLAEAPELPATTLANSCYGGMFSNCALTSVPELPATTLVDYCYYNMFYGCVGLTSVPENYLPATSLAEDCYNSMFRSCRNLVSAPALPATTLAKQCYSYMFEGCTSLTNPPALPATTLAEECYKGMFYSCSGLISLPEDYLPATSLVDGCYREMFRYCKNLTNAPNLPAEVLTRNCYEYMFCDCSSLATPPEISATTLAYGCCYYMFGKCTSLTESPVLRATTLVSSCYAYMFKGCTNLSKITCLATNVSLYSRFEWVNDVSSSGTFYKNSSIGMKNNTTAFRDGWKNDDNWRYTGKDNSSQGVPTGWTVTNY